MLNKYCLKSISEEVKVLNANNLCNKMCRRYRNKSFFDKDVLFYHICLAIDSIKLPSSLIDFLKKKIAAKLNEFVSENVFIISITC